jgi:hypothetical protein
MTERRPPRGIRAGDWRRMVRAAACGIADADLADNDGTPEIYADFALRAIVDDLRWREVATTLADRMQHQAHCEEHREDVADPDCAPCRDRSAYRTWQRKAGIEPRRTEVGDGEVIDVFAHARGDAQYRAFGVTGSKPGDAP